MTSDHPSIRELVAAGARTEPRPLGELIDRLTADGLLRGAREGGRAIGAAAHAGIAVHGVTEDSRSVQPGRLFVAIPGLHADGHDFAEAAAAAGAAAAIVERPLPEVAIPQRVVGRGSAALADAAAWGQGG